MTEENNNPADDAEIIEGHSYDGIREYDNPMPGWWIWIFWACIAFMPFYILGVHVFGYINSYGDDLTESEQDLQEIKDAWAVAHPSFTVDAASLAPYIGDESAINAGAAIFATHCQACHADKGQGLIGPNLTDDYWIHGGTNVDIFNTISNGVLDKGMVAWEATLSAEQRAQLVAFIRSVRGVEATNPKEAQGELVTYSEDATD